MSSTDLTSLRKRAAYDRLAAQKAEIEQALLDLDQEKADLTKNLAENETRVTKFEAQYGQVCIEIEGLKVPIPQQSRTPGISGISPTTKPPRPFSGASINVRAPSASKPLVSDTLKPPKHLEEIHERYRMVLWEASTPGRHDSAGEWKLFSCSRCGANAMPRDGGRRFFGGPRGMAVHFRKQCQRPNESSFTESEILQMCFRIVIPTAVAERLRRGEDVPGAVPMTIKTAGRSKQDSWGGGERNLGYKAASASPEVVLSKVTSAKYEVPMPASPQRWRRIDDSGQDGDVGQKRRRTVEGRADTPRSASEDEDWRPYKREAFGRM